MYELKQIDVVDKAFINVWTTIVQGQSQKETPTIFASQKYAYILLKYNYSYTQNRAEIRTL